MNGIILVNKKKNFTSRDIVNIVGKKLGTKSIGHTGTLDPLATGVLVLVTGSATKIADILSSEEKEYIAGITLGVSTDTLDIEGNILESKNTHISKKDIIKTLNSMKGKYMQEVPSYSAVKVNGKKLYEYARNNEKVTLPKKEVEIKEIELIDDINYTETTTEFKIKCKVSKGTYIRALAKDIGIKLNTFGIMNSLERTKQGIFELDMCQTLEEIYDNNFAIIPIEYILKDYFKIEMDNELNFKVSNGCKLDNIYNQNIVVFTLNNKVKAIYKDNNGILKPWKMFLH